MDDKYANLRTALDAGPTPGPWSVRTGGLDCGLATDCAVHTWERCIAQIVDNPLNRRDATFIAAAHPETIRALLAERDRLRELLEGVLVDDLLPYLSAEYIAKVRAALAQEQGESDVNRD